MASSDSNAKMLEDHTLDFLENWGYSFGLYGEQGVEGLHATINKLNVNYRSITAGKIISQNV